MRERFKFLVSSMLSRRLLCLCTLQYFLSMVNSPAFGVPEDILDRVWRDLYNETSGTNCSWFTFMSDSGKRTGFVRCGSGTKPIVILPGYTEPAKKYMETVLDLSLKRPDLGPIYVMELPGQGSSDRLGSSPVLVHVDKDTRYADDFRTFLSIEVLKNGRSKPIVIAHSTGAIVAYGAAARAPENFDKIIALSPLVRPILPLPPWAVEIVSWLHVKLGFDETPVWGHSPKSINDETFKTNHTTSSSVRWHLFHTYLQVHPSLYTNGISWGWLKSIISEGNFIWKQKDQIKTPILVIRPDKDFYVNVEESDRFCLALPNCSIKSIPGDKHETLQLADPERNQTLYWIIDFIAP